MKIYAFSDTHGNKPNLEIGRGADIILCGGDITNFGAETTAVLHHFQQELNRINKTLLLIHGNHEHEGLRDETQHHPNIKFLHKEAHETKEINFIGYGGGGFDTRNEELPKIIEKLHHPSKKNVWIFHGPPHNTTIDIEPGWGATGNKTKTELIKQYQPELVIAGHIHATAGQNHQLGKTIIINPGQIGILLQI